MKAAKKKKGIEALELASKFVRAMEMRQAKRPLSLTGGSADSRDVVVRVPENGEAPHSTHKGGGYHWVVESPSETYECIVCGSKTDVCSDGRVVKHSHLTKPAIVVCNKCGVD